MSLKQYRYSFIPPRRPSHLSLFADFSQTSDGAADGDGGSGRVCPRTSGNGLTASFAVPNSYDLTFEGVFAAEGAGVGGVL